MWKKSKYVWPEGFRNQNKPYKQGSSISQYLLNGVSHETNHITTIHSLMNRAYLQNRKRLERCIDTSTIVWDELGAFLVWYVKCKFFYILILLKIEWEYLFKVNRSIPFKFWFSRKIIYMLKTLRAQYWFD